MIDDSDYCYKLHHTRKSWAQAYAVCELEGGKLVQIKSQAENDKVVQYAVKRGIEFGAIWLGFNEPANNGKWFWQPDMEPLKFDAWDKTQPNDLYGQDCGSMWVYEEVRGGWNDDECQEKFPFVCMSLKK